MSDATCQALACDADDVGGGLCMKHWRMPILMLQLKPDPRWPTEGAETIRDLEREACAQLAEVLAKQWALSPSAENMSRKAACEGVAAAIRARGSK